MLFYLFKLKLSLSLMYFKTSKTFKSLLRMYLHKIIILYNKTKKNCVGTFTVFNRFNVKYYLQIN